jgi:predicted TIM-barrel fold metal-dependent hydrolase
MYDGTLVIDSHGHMSTPPEFRGYAYNMIALRTPSNFHLTAAQMEGALTRHIRVLDERNIDVQMISPRPVAYMHWERPYLVKSWTDTTNEVIAQQCELLPERFVGVAQLPQTPLEDTSNSADVLERCVREYGFVAADVNPDPGGDRATPGMNDPYWYPLYERSEALQATLIIHPSISRDPRLDPIPHSYQFNNIAEETLAMMLYVNTDVFDRFPALKIVVCHCGGSLSRLIEHGEASGEQGGGSVGIVASEREDHLRDTSANLFVDSCAYEPNFLATAIKQYGVDQMVFGTEAPGSGTAILNPLTKRPSDDLIPVLETFDFLTNEDRRKILHDNLLRVFPLLGASRALAGRI